MLDTQAERLIERLKNACTYHRFDEPGVHAEYMRFLMRYDFDRMNEAIDAAIEEDSRNVPPISAIVKKYKEIKEGPKGNTIIKNEEYCAVCDDNGFVLIKEKQQDSGLIYEYMLYCPFCAVGRSWAYDGKQCKERKSPYRIPPLTEYFGDEGIQVLREANLKRRQSAQTSRSLDSEQLKALGKDMPKVPECEAQDDFDEMPF